MRTLVRAPKDFWAGVVYVGIGLAALWLGSRYQIGTASRMGPGYFPIVLSSLLVFIGTLSLFRSIRLQGEPVETVALKPLALILSACALFAFMLPRMGLIVALVSLALVSAAASIRFKLELRAVLGLIAFIICCVLVFVKFLGIPMPLLGSWLVPVLGPIFPFLR